MSTSERTYLRLHRDPDPLAAYVRPLERDYSHVAKLISAGFPVGTGIVVDACHPRRSDDLRSSARDHGLELVLDPRSIDLSTRGGMQRSGVLDLPWSTGDLDEPSAFVTARVERFAGALAQSAVQLGVDAVLAPTHYLESALAPWFEVDVALTQSLRAALDQDVRGRRVRIYYPLASSLSVLLSDLVMPRVVESLAELAAAGSIDGIWTRVHNFGTNTAGPLTLPRYIRVARALHAVGVPIVADRTGTVGLPLLALGAVVGIESGVTHGERFSIGDLKRPRAEGAKGGLAPRVYLPPIGVFLKRDDAARFLNTRGIRATFGCQLACCPRGVPDMLGEMRRHFLVSRSTEVERLAQVPRSMRVEHYFSTWLRFAADRAARAALVIGGMDKHRRRLDMWRATLSTQVERDLQDPPTVSPRLELPDSQGGEAAEGP